MNHFFSKKESLNDVELGDDGLLQLLKKIKAWLVRHGYGQRPLPELPALLEPKKKENETTEKEDMKKFQENAVQTLATSSKGLEDKFTLALDRLFGTRGKELKRKKPRGDGGTGGGFAPPGKIWGAPPAMETFTKSAGVFGKSPGIFGKSPGIFANPVFGKAPGGPPKKNPATVPGTPTDVSSSSSSSAAVKTGMAGVKTPVPKSPLEEDRKEDADMDAKEEDDCDDEDDDDKDVDDENEDEDDDATIPAGANFQPTLLDHLWNMVSNDVEEVNQARGPDLIPHDPANPLQNLPEVNQFMGEHDDPNTLIPVNGYSEEHIKLHILQNFYAEDLQAGALMMRPLNTILRQAHAPCARLRAMLMTVGYQPSGRQRQKWYTCWVLALAGAKSPVLPEEFA